MHIGGLQCIRNNLENILGMCRKKIASFSNSFKQLYNFSAVTQASFSCNDQPINRLTESATHPMGIKSIMEEQAANRLIAPPWTKAGSIEFTGLNDVIFTIFYNMFSCIRTSCCEDSCG